MHVLLGKSTTPLTTARSVTPSAFVLPSLVKTERFEEVKMDRTTTKLARAVIGVAAVLLIAAPAGAAVINFADVNGLRTFQDTNTGRVWLDMDNFFDVAANNGTTGNAMIATAAANGFKFATRAEVEELLGSLPLESGQWAGYAAVMGYGHPRGLIWGMYDDGTPGYMGWAWAYSYDTSWSYVDNVLDPAFVPNNGIAGSVDMGIWAYQTGQVAVPEPATLVLLGLGLIGLGAARRKRAR